MASEYGYYLIDTATRRIIKPVVVLEAGLKECEGKPTRRLWSREARCYVPRPGDQLTLA